MCKPELCGVAQGRDGWAGLLCAAQTSCEPVYNKGCKYPNGLDTREKLTGHSKFKGARHKDAGIGRNDYRTY